MKTAHKTLAAIAAVLCLGAAAASAQEAGGGHIKGLVIDAIKPTTPAKLTVTTPAFKNGGDIPFENTQYRGNTFPGLTWTAGPPGTKSYVVLMQGVLGGPSADSNLGTSIHFNLFNVPPEVTSLKTGLTAAPAGAMYGASLHGLNQGYVGPHTHNFVKHAYHLQVFALDRTAPADPKTSLEDLEKLMDGHVLASGEVVGWVAMDPDSPEAAEYRAKQQQQGKPPA